MQDKGGLCSLCSEPGSLQEQVFRPSLLIRKLVTALPFEGKPHPCGSCACTDVLEGWWGVSAQHCERCTV